MGPVPVGDQRRKGHGGPPGRRPDRRLSSGSQRRRRGRTEDLRDCGPSESQMWTRVVVVLERRHRSAMLARGNLHV